MKNRTANLLLIASFSLQGNGVSHPLGARLEANSCRRARPYVAKAQAAISTGRGSAARELLTHALQLDSGCAEAYIVLGTVEFHDGNTNQAINLYKHSLQLQPRSYPAHYNLALAYLREHNLQAARSELEGAIRLDGNQADAAYDLGVVLLELGQPSAALVHLRRAKALNPHRPDVAFNIVRGELEAGHGPQALAEAQASAERLGGDFDWNAAIGQVFLKHAEPRPAAIFLEKAVRLRPGDDGTRRQLATAYLEMHDPEEVQRTIPQPKTAEDHYLRASAYYLSHRFSQADQESQQALSLAPDNPEILILRVRLLQRAGEQEAAIAMAQKAIAAAPGWEEPYYLAGVSYYFLRHYDEAGRSLSRAIELNPNSVRALFLQGVNFANLGKTSEAEQSFRRSIALQPKNARLHCHLGILLARENRRDEAATSFAMAIKLSPDYPLSHYEMGKLLVSAKRFHDAAQELQEAVTYDPNLGAAFYQLGLVYARLGEGDKSKQALAQFEKLYRKENSDPDAGAQAVDQDARKATQF
jgi:tetratricopeptide (TPR) repeat protein